MPSITLFIVAGSNFLLTRFFALSLLAIRCTAISFLTFSFLGIRAVLSLPS